MLANFVPPTGSPLALALSELDSLSTEALKQELARAFGNTIAALLRLAACVRILEDRGEDLSDIHTGLLTYVRQIAYGQTIPEVVLAFATRRLLLSRVTRLTLPEQQRLANGTPILLVVRREDSFDTRLTPVTSLTGRQVHQVFTESRLRSEAEQKVFLENANTTPIPLPKARTIKADNDRCGLVINRTFVSQADVLSALADLTSGEDSAPPSRTGTPVPVLLTDSEHKALKIRSAKTDTPMSELIRRAMRACGLLTTEP